MMRRELLSETQLPKTRQLPPHLETTWEAHAAKDKSRLVREAEQVLSAHLKDEERAERTAEHQPVVRVVPDQKLRVALVGAVNAGKSTLFNALTAEAFGRFGRTRNIASDHNALTRDAVENVGELDEMVFTVIDTPGVYEGAIADEARRCLESADVVVFVVSAAATTISSDESALAAMLRKRRLPTVVAVNKIDQVEETDLPDVLEVFRTLGLGRPVALSALSGTRGFDVLADALRPFFNMSIERRVRADWALEDLAQRGDEDAMDEVRTRNNTDEQIRVCFVGASNAGKSSLVNRIMGNDRSRVSKVAETTRDAIETPVVYRGRKLRLIDTAGYVKWRYSKRSEVLTSLTNASMKALKYAHVIVVVTDGTEGQPHAATRAVMARALEEGRAVVLAVSKWDAVMDPSATAEAIDYRIKKSASDMRRVQAVVTSAKEGTNLTLLLDQVLQAFDTWNKRLRSRDLTRFWRRFEKTVVIPHDVSRVGRISQVATRPPTFCLMLQTRSDEDKLRGLQLETVRNALAEEFELDGVPVRFVQRVKESHPDIV